MSGFKAFLLKGDLVQLAVAVIIAGSFGTVVKTFTDVLTGFIGKIFGQPKVGQVEIAGVAVGPFINAVIAFVILAAIVYFLVVMPYTRAKAKFFPAEASGPTEIELLTQIRDQLAQR